MSASPAAPSSASVSACATTSPSECPTRPRGWSIATPPRTSGTPSPNAWASTPRPTRRSLTLQPGAHAVGTLAPPGARRARRSRRAPSGVALQEPPRPAAEVDRDEPRGERRHARRCRPGRRRRRPRRRAARRARPARAKNAGSGLRTPRLAEPVTMSTGSPADARPASSASLWLPASPTRSPAARSRSRHVERIRDRGRRVEYTIASHASGALDAEVAPELPVLLAALDRHAERRPDDVRAEPAAARHLAPVALLVDERLADVEEDRADRHAQPALEQPLDEREVVGVVTFTSRGSPATTPTRPPARSTSDAQSVASAEVPGVRGAEPVGDERLRRLGRDERSRGRASRRRARRRRA